MSSLQEFEVHLGILSGISPRFFSGNVPQIVSMNFENFPHDFVRNSSRILQGFFFSNLVKEFLWQFFQDVLHESFRTSSRNLFRFYSKRCFRNSFQVFFQETFQKFQQDSSFKVYLVLFQKLKKCNFAKNFFIIFFSGILTGFF